MGFLDDLAKIVADPEVRRLAERRAGCHELAEDALHDTFRAVAQHEDPGDIRDLRAFFRTSLIREINHQLTRPAATPTEDIGGFPIAARSERLFLRVRLRLLPSQGQASLHILAQVVLADWRPLRRASPSLVPARSDDARRYRAAIHRGGVTILSSLVEGYVAQADWNAVLRAAYPQWCDEPGLARDASDKRLSRARQTCRCCSRSLFPGTSSRPERPRGALSSARWLPLPAHQ